jgi:hypothetical protein
MYLEESETSIKYMAQGSMERQQKALVKIDRDQMKSRNIEL